jgi:hypothetical protein
MRQPMPWPARSSRPKRQWHGCVRSIPLCMFRTSSHRSVGPKIWPSTLRACGEREYPSDRYRQTCRRVRSLVPSDCAPKQHGPRSKSSKVVFLRLLCLVGTTVQTRHANIGCPASISCQGTCGPRSISASAIPCGLIEHGARRPPAHAFSFTLEAAAQSAATCAALHPARRRTRPCRAWPHRRASPSARDRSAPRPR